MDKKPNVLWFDQVDMQDVALVGGKNASLEEMIKKFSKKILVPFGFATTTFAFNQFLKENHLHSKIQKALIKVDAKNVATLKKKGA